MKPYRPLLTKKIWTLLFFVTLMTAAQQSVGAEKYVYKYVLSKESKLTRTESEYGGPDAYFTGEVTIKARYQFIYDDGTGLPDNPYFVIYPDGSVMKQLPYLIERDRPEYATEILIHGADKIALELLGPDLAGQVATGKYPFISGEAEFVLTSLYAGYECDQPSFVGKYTRINKTISAPSFTKISMASGC